MRQLGGGESRLCGGAGGNASGNEHRVTLQQRCRLTFSVLRQGTAGIEGSGWRVVQLRGGDARGRDIVEATRDQHATVRKKSGRIRGSSVVKSSGGTERAGARVVELGRREAVARGSRPARDQYAAVRQQGFRLGLTGIGQGSSGAEGAGGRVVKLGGGRSEEHT